MQIFKGTVEKVIFQKEGFSIFRISFSDGGSATAKGEAYVQEGDVVAIEGEWTTHPLYGQQIKALTVSVSLPQDKEGMIRYLGSGIFPGIGKKLAARIVERFGLSTFEVMDKNLDRLLEISGISKKKLESIRRNWQRESSVKKIMSFLHGHNLTPTLVNRIYRFYLQNGKSSPDEIIHDIRANPWNLARKIEGIGFLTADRLALSIGKSPTDPDRLLGALLYCLEEKSDMGDCGIESQELLEKASALLKVPREMVLDVWEKQKESGLFFVEDDITWVSSLYRQETEIFRMLKRLSEGAPPWGKIDIEDAIAKAGTLAEQQKQAMRMVLTNKVSVVTGGPGCGKTFLLNAILKTLANKVRFVLAAPTGRAACRMEESTGFYAGTLHRILKLNSPEKIVLDCDFLVIDESSMNDVSLFYHALSRLPAHASLLLVGDSDQLPSVGPGSVLRDIIESGVIPVTRLNKVFRQAENSGIIRAAHCVNEGKMPKSVDKDFWFIEEDDPEQIPGIIKELVANKLPSLGFDPVKDIQVLSPMRKTLTGTNALNELIQHTLNPSPSDCLHVGKTRFGIGDKVMQTVNNYDKGVFNGDLGIVEAIDRDEGIVIVRYKEKDVEYFYDDLEELTLASAITIHKSQGSDFPAVVIPVAMQHYVMLQRNLIYTGITRARQLCVIVGQKKALSLAIKNTDSKRRLTRLGKLLQSISPSERNSERKSLSISSH